MSDASCARWATLTDRLSLGDSLGRDDQSFLAAHARTCPTCAREAAFYDGLTALLGEHAPVPEATEATEEAGRSPAAPRRRRVGVPAFAAVALVAAAAAVLLWVHRPEPTQPAAATVTLLQGEIDGARGPATAGDRLAQGDTLRTGRGRACLRLEPAVRLCLAEETTIRFEDLEGPHRVVRLERGRAAAELEPQAPGTSFAIATRDATSIAVGTAFSVEVGAEGPAVTRVSHGVVLVRSGASEQRVGAHEVVRGAEAPRALPIGDEGADDALLRAPPAARGRRSEEGRVTIESAPAGLRVEIDGMFVGTTPLDVLMDPGTHPVAVEGFATAPIVVRAGEHVHKTVASRAASPPPASAAPSAPPLASEPGAASTSTSMATPAPSSPSPATLLDAARAAAARGDRAAALRSYRELIQTRPGSGEAQTALVSVAELELQGGSHAAALADFDRYLARGGALALESRYGRIRALEGLGRRSEAQAAIDAFLSDYPDSPQAEALRARAP